MSPPPLVEQLPACPALDPALLWPAFAARPGCAFLDTALPGPRARFSILACEPRMIIRQENSVVIIERADRPAERLPGADSLNVLRELLAARACAPVPGLPFVGGAIGWLGYETGAARDGVYSKNPDTKPRLPALAFGVYDSALVFDHATSRATLVAPDPASLARLRALIASRAPPPAFSQSMIDVASGCSTRHHSRLDLRPDLERATYARAVERIRAYIASGDVYQVNFTQRFTTPLSCSAAALHARLRALSPAPHAAYLDFGDHQIVSSTPERLLRVHGRRLETRPIKGTIARLADADADAINRTRLLASAKDHAELLMIVDLARNDLGRVAIPGSVRVEARHELETYATVHHLVATICAELAPGLDRFDALRALHPGGSITGAPKIRAMQIISELEPVPRHVYTGALGYLGYDGDADLAIAIRTITCAEGLATYHVGGGITWDSEADSEYEETLHKGRAMQQSLQSP
jgi:para-aminobenzoate synthetase component 1